MVSERAAGGGTGAAYGDAAVDGDHGTGDVGAGGEQYVVRRDWGTGGLVKSSGSTVKSYRGMSSGSFSPAASFPVVWAFSAFSAKAAARVRRSRPRLSGPRSRCACLRRPLR
jgi:hypothetical protein